MTTSIIDLPAGFQEILRTLDGWGPVMEQDELDLPQEVTILAVGAPVTGTSSHIDALLVRHFGEDAYRWWQEPAQEDSQYVTWHFVRQ